jgi:hypothetical protein
MLQNYKKLENGVITQIDREPYNYSYEYSNNYNKLGELGIRMGYLRLGHLIGSIGIPKSVMDIGYGNGDFLKSCLDIIPNCYASDVSVYPCPEGCTFVSNPYENEVDVVTMYDVLEHYNDIYDIKNLKTKYLILSMPECHYISDEWFSNWKHRKPNEHLWHFNKTSLTQFMSEVGFEMLSISNIEDTIRKPTDSYTNIMTGVFKKI